MQAGEENALLKGHTQRTDRDAAALEHYVKLLFNCEEVQFWQISETIEIAVVSALDKTFVAPYTLDATGGEEAMGG